MKLLAAFLALTTGVGYRRLDDLAVLTGGIR